MIDEGLQFYTRDKHVIVAAADVCDQRFWQNEQLL